MGPDCRTLIAVEDVTISSVSHLKKKFLSEGIKSVLGSVAKLLQIWEIKAIIRVLIYWEILISYSERLQKVFKSMYYKGYQCGMNVVIYKGRGATQYVT